MFFSEGYPVFFENFIGLVGKPVFKFYLVPGTLKTTPT